MQVDTLVLTHQTSLDHLVGEELMLPEERKQTLILRILDLESVQLTELAFQHQPWLSDPTS
jgi:hypothetical protein